MDQTSTQKINKLKEQIRIIEEQEKMRKTELDKSNINYNLDLISNIIENRRFEGYFSSKCYINYDGKNVFPNPQKDLTVCLSKIHNILTLINKELIIIKDNNI